MYAGAPNSRFDLVTRNIETSGAYTYVRDDIDNPQLRHGESVVLSTTIRRDCRGPSEAPKQFKKAME